MASPSLGGTAQLRAWDVPTATWIYRHSYEIHLFFLVFFPPFLFYNGQATLGCGGRKKTTSGRIYSLLNVQNTPGEKSFCFVLHGNNLKRLIRSGLGVFFSDHLHLLFFHRETAGAEFLLALRALRLLPLQKPLEVLLFWFYFSRFGVISFFFCVSFFFFFFGGRIAFLPEGRLK